MNESAILSVASTGLLSGFRVEGYRVRGVSGLGALGLRVSGLGIRAFQDS